MTSLEWTRNKWVFQICDHSVSAWMQGMWLLCASFACAYVCLMYLDLLTRTCHTRPLIVTDSFQPPLYFWELSGILFCKLKENSSNFYSGAFGFRNGCRNINYGLMGFLACTGGAFTVNLCLKLYEKVQKNYPDQESYWSNMTAWMGAHEAVASHVIVMEQLSRYSYIIISTFNTELVKGAKCCFC